MTLIFNTILIIGAFAILFWNAAHPDKQIDLLAAVGTLTGLGIGGNYGIGKYSESRGMSKSAPVTVERTVYPINNQPDPDVIRRQQEIESKLRQAVIEALNNGIDVNAFINQTKQGDVTT